MGFKIGVDVGGTFTDFLLTDKDGNKNIYKTLTTPKNPSEGFFQGIKKIAEDRGISVEKFLQEVDSIIHGTTITTNAVLTGRGAKTGFITTKGFRDVLNMRRGLKEEQYSFKNSPPEPLVPPHLVRVVNERVNCEGNVVTPLEEESVHAAADYFKQKEVEAIAVSLLFSFLNPEHERRIAKILKESLPPQTYISVSSDVLPQIRAYERHSTTTLNAYVGPILSSYLQALLKELRRHNYRGLLLIMQSNGGVMSPEVAERFAGNTLLSGPAGGPTAGLFYSNIHGLSNFITVDMGGTSFDACMVINNEPTITTEGHVGAHQLALPMLNIHTVGAGGGSIAWVDEGGLLQVGPKSAGALPGPVCYNRGGSDPTSTDADLLLGYLDPDFFSGGEINLNVDLTKKILQEKIAEPLNMDLIEAASGIYKVINANMANALRVVSIEKGYDPREFALIVAGGAGPIHAGMIAQEMEIPMVIVPRESSVFCAAGMLFSDLKHDLVRSYTIAFDSLNLKEVNRRYEEMRSFALNTLDKEGIPKAKIKVTYSVDVHYIGQFNEVEVPLFLEDRFGEKELQQLVEDFHNKHNQLYGYSLPQAPLELINLRLTAFGITDKPVFAKANSTGSSVSIALKGHREAFFDGKFETVSVFDGLKMEYGHTVDGPCIIEQPTTTIIVPTGYALGCDEYQNYVIFHMELASKEIKEKFGRKFSHGNKEQN